MASAPQKPASLHEDPATEPVTATAKTNAMPKARKKTTAAAALIPHQEALTIGTPRPAAAAAARNYEPLPTRHTLHRTFDSSFQGHDWPAIRRSRRIHLATPGQRRRYEQPWCPNDADSHPVFAYDPARARQPGSAQRRGPAGWPANVVLTAQTVGVLEHVKAACEEVGDRDGRKWWEALCAARWPLNFTGTGKPRVVQPVAPVGWPREGVKEGDEVVDAEEGVMAVVGSGGDGEGGRGTGKKRVVVVASKAKSMMHSNALRKHVAETSVPADDGGGARKTGISDKRPAEDWRIDDAAHKRFLSDMQGSIMRLKKLYDEAKTESVQIPPLVRDQELRRLADLEAEKSKNAARIQELEAELQKKQALNQSHATKLETLQQTVLDLEEDQQIEIENQEKCRKDLQAQIERYQENIECLSRNGAISNTKIIELQRSLEEWQSQAQKLQIQNENDRKSLQTIEQESATQQTKIGALEEKLKDNQSRAQILQSQNEREHAKLQESQTQVTELTAKLEVATKRERRLEESLGFVAQTMLDMIGKDNTPAEKVPGELTNGADVTAEQDGLKKLLEQLLAGQNGE